MMDSSANSAGFSAKKAYIVVGVVAAAVSASTAAYIFWTRARRMSSPQVDSVQNLLERCHSQVKAIEKKLSELSAGSASSIA